MPGKDRTFSAKDIIRIISANLTRKEQVLVLISICKGVRIEVFDDKAILVPLTSQEEALEEQDIIEDLISLIF